MHRCTVTTLTTETDVESIITENGPGKGGGGGPCTELVAQLLCRELAIGKGRGGRSSSSPSLVVALRRRLTRRLTLLAAALSQIIFG